MDFRVLKYFPFGGAKRFAVVVEFFNLFNSTNVTQINPVCPAQVCLRYPDLGNRLPEPVPAKSSSRWISSFENGGQLHMEFLSQGRS